MVTFYAGQRVTAAQLEALVDYTTRIDKVADETVSASTTFQDDDEIVFTGLLAGSTYELTGTAIYSGTTGGGLKIQWSWPAGSSGYFSYGAQGIHDAWADGGPTQRDVQCLAGSKNISSPSDYTWWGSSTPQCRSIQWHARMVLGVSGTLTMQWAQFTASGSTVMKKGTWFALKKLT